MRIIFKNTANGIERDVEYVTREMSLIGVRDRYGRVPVQYDANGNGPYIEPLWDFDRIEYDAADEGDTSTQR